MKIDVSERVCSVLTLCRYENIQKQNCSKCATHKISEQYRSIIINLGEEEIKTKRWKYVKESKKVKNVNKIICYFSSTSTETKRIKDRTSLQGGNIVTCTGKGVKIDSTNQCT